MNSKLALYVQKTCAAYAYMLIDELLPAYDVSEYHQIGIHAPLERVYDAVRALDLSCSRVIRWLFLLRELPALWHSSHRGDQRFDLTLDGLLRSGFILLGEKPPQELLLGLVGRFWTPSGDIQRLSVSEFRTFNRPGYAKAAWNFSLSEQEDGTTRLVTQTRVLCLDEASRRRLRLYWVFIRPFSGLIRREMLRSIKSITEDSNPE